MLLVAVRTHAEMVACIIGDDMADMRIFGFVGKRVRGGVAFRVSLGDSLLGVQVLNEVSQPRVGGGY